jgi:ATP-binding cassette subfamily F protein uup
VLDEPTNDLDLETLDLLQEVIADYEGTVLIVSHDRDFLDKTVTVTLGLDGSGRVDIVAGGYEDWAKRRPGVKAPAKTTSRPASAVPAAPAKKLSYKDQRDLDRLPGEVDRLEAEIADIEQRLADPDLYARDRKAFDELTVTADAKRAEKEAAEERWLEVVELSEALAG